MREAVGNVGEAVRREREMHSLDVESLVGAQILNPALRVPRDRNRFANGLLELGVEGIV